MEGGEEDKIDSERAKSRFETFYTFEKQPDEQMESAWQPAKTKKLTSEEFSVRDISDC